MDLGGFHPFFALDAAGSVVRPAKLWCDTESAPQAASISESEAFGGWPMAASFTASKVAWMRDEEPENFARTETVLLPRDYVNFRLTGAVATEAGDASGSGVFDLNTRMYDESQCDAVDGRLLEMLPKDVLPPDSKVGVVTRAAADRTGLPVGCPVATGSGDNACAAIGVGATRPGRLVVSLGTSGTLFGASDVPVFDVTGAIAPFCDALGGYLPLLCTLNCTRVVEEARRQIASRYGDETLYEGGLSIRTTLDPEMQAMARKALIDGEQKLTDEQWVAPFETLAKWADYLGDGFEAQTYPDSQNLFTLGRAAIYPAGSWEISGFNTQADFQMGAFKPPVQNAGDTCYISDHTDIGIGMNAATDNPEAARTFLAWVASPEFAEIFGNALPGFFPLSSAPVTLEDPLAHEIISWRGACESSIRSTYQILSRGTPNLENDTWNASVAVIKGEESPEDAGKRLQEGLASWYAPQQ